MTPFEDSVSFDYDKVDFTKILQSHVQSGQGSFVGTRYQRGKGIGGILKRYREMIPAISKPSETSPQIQNMVPNASSLEPVSKTFKKAEKRPIVNLAGQGKRRGTSTVYLPSP